MMPCEVLTSALQLESALPVFMHPFLPSCCFKLKDKGCLVIIKTGRGEKKQK